MNTSNILREDIGKCKISIMGDSISTYEGYNPPDYHVYYTLPVAKLHGLESVNDTWWKQVIDRLGAQLCVNNSYSGSVVACGGVKPACSQQRCEGLGLENNIPDIILIYMGTNDSGFGVDVGLDDPDFPLKFYGAYRLMLREVKKNYPSAKVVCATIITGYVKGKDNAKMPQYVNEYNEAIRLAVKEEGCMLADIALAGERFETLDGCHPTKKGHDTLARLWLEELLDKIL